MLQPYYIESGVEAGCDEAGRGCLAGPVFAAAVILPKSFKSELLNDSKKIKEADRYYLRGVIQEQAISYGVAMLDHHKIDHYNILNASIRSMHKALDGLDQIPSRILVDGNKFIPYKEIEFHCMIKGDGRFYSIAAASILAKTYRDDFMKELHELHPQYNWQKNKGYPTEEHRKAIIEHGPCEYHRKSFQLYPAAYQSSLFNESKPK